MCRQYFLGSAKQEPGDPTSRDNGKVLWKEAVLIRPNLTDWQKEESGQAMAWYFKTLGAFDNAGRTIQ
ncbi:MAG: hypothetical protein O3C20_06495 [Verrucomicrobia bacterium]|nr:hypothetical protein [Verrucomicrobiota bacterium]